jgi:hypothetical protein
VKRRTLILLASLVVLAGCGGDDDGAAETESATTPETTARETTQPETTKRETTKRETTKRETTAPKTTPKRKAKKRKARPSCARFLPSKREGTCEQGNTKLKVVNRGTPLRLDDMTVRVQRIKITPVPGKKAKGAYVLMRLKVRNGTNARVAFDRRPQAALFVGKYRYETRERRLPRSIRPLLLRQVIRPKASKSGYIVFLLARSYARRLKQGANGLAVFGFADAKRGIASARRGGFIRLGR